MATMVFRYELLPPSENAEVVRAQMRDTHRMRNKHVEIERARRAAHRSAMSAYEDIRMLELAIADASDAVRAAELVRDGARAQRRDKRDAVEVKATIKVAKARKAELLRQLRERRKALREDAVAQRKADEANEAASLARKATRAEFSQMGKRMRHGTYTMIESAAEQAAKAPMYDGIEPNDPKFKPWLGEGRIGAQITGEDTGGATLGELAGHSFLRIEPAEKRERPTVACEGCRRENPHAPGYVCPPRRERTNGCKRCCPIVDRSLVASEFRRLMLRIGTDPETRGPVWGVWPMRMHRQLPEGSRIAFAAVSVRKIGPREEWSTELTVNLPSGRVPSGEGTLAIDVGWRIIEDEIRVCAWRADRAMTDAELERLQRTMGANVRIAPDRTGGELRLTADDIAELRMADGLQSTRKTTFNTVLGGLCEWLRGREEMPEWMRLRTVKRKYDADGKEIPREVPSQAQAIAWLSEWEAQGKLAALVRTWAENRFDGDAAMFGSLEAWRYHDYHLWQWESGQRKGSHRRRRDIYRRFATVMAGIFGTIVLEDFDLRVVARRAPKESQERENETARSNRQMVALSELRLCLTNRFGGAWWKAPSRDTTRRCSVCGSIEKFNAAEERTHTCRNGHTWDQDDNACQNLLTIFCERRSDCIFLGSARSVKKANENGEVKESRRAKAKRMAAERRERLGTSRKPDGNVSE